MQHKWFVSCSSIYFNPKSNHSTFNSMEYIFTSLKVIILWLHLFSFYDIDENKFVTSIININMNLLELSKTYMYPNRLYLVLFFLFFPLASFNLNSPCNVKRNGSFKTKTIQEKTDSAIIFHLVHDRNS